MAMGASWFYNHTSDRFTKFRAVVRADSPIPGNGKWSGTSHPFLNNGPVDRTFPSMTHFENPSGALNSEFDTPSRARP